MRCPGRANPFDENFRRRFDAPDDPMGKPDNRGCLGGEQLPGQVNVWEVQLNVGFLVRDE